MSSVMKMKKALTKDLSSLVEDIYKTLEEGCVNISDEKINKLCTALTTTITQRLTQSSSRRDHLSLSSIGKPLRRLWYDLKEPCEEPVSGQARLKFLYGDIIETLALWLCEVAGHEVGNQQDEVVHHGVVGHIDSIIDGEVVDVKSASPRSFMKFARGTLIEDDPFGYLAQIASYDQEVGKGHPAFLVINKVNGEICLYEPNPDFDLPDTKMLIDNCKEALAKDTPPDTLCYSDEEDGKSGNRKLCKSCSFCPYKKRCWPGLRAFNYSDGVRYLTSIKKEPKVDEVNID